MWSPKKYLDLCCSFYKSMLLPNFSKIVNQPEVTNYIPIEDFPISLSCCLFRPVSYDIDILTNNLIPIYGYVSADEPDPYSLTFTDSWTQETEVNTSHYNFIGDIWNTRADWEILVKTIAVLPLVIVAILGNLTVIRIVLKAKLTRNPVNLFILNMSIADFLTALIYPWIFLVSDFYQRFVLGKVICKYEGFVLITLMLTSVLSLTVISYDRLTAVVFPFKKRMEPRRARVLIYCVWIIALSVSSPLIIWRSYRERQWKDFNEVWCAENIQALKNYWFCLVVLLVWIPILVLTISYTTIVVKLEALEKRQRDHSITQVKCKSKVIRMLFIILILFSACWIPFTALIFVRNHRTTNEKQVEITEWYRSLFFISHYLMFVNAAVNPIIYGLKNDNFRREFRNTLPTCLKRKKEVQVSTIGQKKLISNKRTTGLQALADKYAIILTPTPTTLLSGTVPSLNSFERRNSALLDLGLPVPPPQSDDFDSLEFEYHLFQKKE